VLGEKWIATALSNFLASWSGFSLIVLISSMGRSMSAPAGDEIFEFYKDASPDKAIGERMRSCMPWGALIQGVGFA